ncbi:TPA: glycoside hydrolase family 99-like domain-containing protein [Citrobacter braakii]
MSDVMKKPIVLAYYLPQFYETPENNEWWGKGFTEWTALRQSVSYKPNQKIRRPIEPLGYYELPNHTVLEQQYRLAKEHDIDGFFIWDYWFGRGEKLLDKPKDFLLDNNLDFKYAFIWANHSWFNKTKNIMLKEQFFLGEKDYKDYFDSILPHMKKEMYLKISNKPIFGLFMPSIVPDLDTFMRVFTNAAIDNGFDGIYWIAENTKKENDFATEFDSYLNSTKYFINRKFYHPLNFSKEILIKKFNLNNIGPVHYSYRKLVSNYNSYDGVEVAAVFTGWDTTPRHKLRGTILHDFDELAFEQHIDNVFHYTKKKNKDVIIIKSWNEWAEGNLLEPDNLFDNKLLNIFSNKYRKIFGK